MNGEADFLRGLLLTPVWDLERLRSEIDAICEQCSGPSWPVVASRLSRYMPWEYEYRLDDMQDVYIDRPLPPWRLR